MHTKDEIRSWSSAWAHDEMIRIISADSCFGFGDGTAQMLNHLESMTITENRESDQRWRCVKPNCGYEEKRSTCKTQPRLIRQSLDKRRTGKICYDRHYLVDQQVHPG